MAVPGSNLLNVALRVIAKQQVDYAKYLRRTRNTEGIWVPEYATGLKLRGSLQAVPRTMYKELGLDFQKNYITFYASAALLDVQRDVSCDQIAYAGRVYAVESSNDWYAMDGWVGVLCVQVTPEEFERRFNDRFNNRYQ